MVQKKTFKTHTRTNTSRNAVLSILIFCERLLGSRTFLDGCLAIQSKSDKCYVRMYRWEIDRPQPSDPQQIVVLRKLRYAITMYYDPLFALQVARNISLV